MCNYISDLSLLSAYRICLLGPKLDLFQDEQRDNLGRNHLIKFFAQFSFGNVFLSYHTWTQFSCSSSCQTKAYGFFRKKIADAITHSFFLCESIYSVVKKFL